MNFFVVSPVGAAWFFEGFYMWTKQGFDTLRVSFFGLRIAVVVRFRIDLESVFALC